MRLLLSLALLLPQDPPAGHPFGDVAKAALLVQYLNIMADWRPPFAPNGVGHLDALAAAALVLGVPNWTPAAGVGPIIAAIP